MEERDERVDWEARALFDDDRDIEVDRDTRPLRDVLLDIDLSLVPVGVERKEAVNEF